MATKARIVIADDDSIIRMDLKEQLSGLGYQVIGEAIDAQSAIDLAKLLRRAQEDPEFIATTNNK